MSTISSGKSRRSDQGLPKSLSRREGPRVLGVRMGRTEKKKTPAKALAAKAGVKKVSKNEVVKKKSKIYRWIHGKQASMYKCAMMGQHLPVVADQEEASKAATKGKKSDDIDDIFAAGKSNNTRCAGRELRAS